MIAKYSVGEEVVLVAVVTQDGSPWSGPAYFRVNVPNEDDDVTVTVVEAPAGTYTGTFGPITQSGRHHYSFWATGVVHGVEERWFDVYPVHTTAVI